MAQNRQRGICNKAGFMKGRGHHYSRTSWSNCANGPYLLSFTFYHPPPPPTPPLSSIFSSLNNVKIQSHFCTKKILNKQGVTIFPVVSLPRVLSPPHPFSEWCGAPLFHSYCKWPCNGAPEARLKRRFCLHTRAERCSQTILTERPPLLTSLPLGICCQILFHFPTNHLERGNGPHPASRMSWCPCGLAQLLPYCAIPPLSSCVVSFCLNISAQYTQGV